MKTHTNPLSLVSILGLAIALVGCASQPDTGESKPGLRIAAPQSGDLHVRQLYRGADLAGAVHTQQELITTSWALSATRTLHARPKPHVARSREFLVRVSAARLAAGVALPLTAPGAVVKITPHGDLGGKRLDPKLLVLVDPNGRAHFAGAAMQRVVTDRQLRDAGMEVKLGTSAFKLNPSLGAGRYVMRMDVDKAAELRGEVTIHVLERNATTRLELTTDRATCLRGDTVTVRATWVDSRGQQIVGQKIKGRVIEAGGAEQSFTLRADGAEGYVGQVKLEQGTVRPGRSVEIIVEAAATLANGQSVRRRARTAVGYALPTARVTSQVAVQRKAEYLEIGVTVEAGSKGRYAVTGVLYGTNQAGQLVPVAVAQSARFIDAGASVAVPLRIKHSILAGANVKAPFELRDLRLQDQSRLATLHHQALGLRF